MSVPEMRDRPGRYTVVVNDRVTGAGEKPAKVTKRVKGLRNAQDVDQGLNNLREDGSLLARSQTLSAYAARYLESRRAEVSRQTYAGYARIVHEYIHRHAIGAMKVSDVNGTIAHQPLHGREGAQGRQHRGARLRTRHRPRGGAAVPR